MNPAFTCSIPLAQSLPVVFSQLDLSGNELCGVDRFGGGTYTAEGITALADALRVTAELTRCDMRANMLGADGKAALRSAVQGRSGFKLML